MSLDEDRLAASSQTEIPFAQYKKSLGFDQQEALDYLGSRTDETKVFEKYRKPIENPLVIGYNYLFVTAPDLAISRYASSLMSTGGSGFSTAASSILERNLRALQLDGASSIYTEAMIDWLTGKGDQFIPLLTNRAASYVMSDTVLGTMDYAETWNRYKIVLGTSAKDSRISGNLTVNYQEDDFMTIMKLHHLWITYIEKCFIGDVVSGGVLLSSDYMSNETRTIDYMSSMYEFTVSPDGETLMYWCKYTGLFPVKCPWSEFTSEDGGADVKKFVPVEYQFTYKEEMTLDVLSDFNLLQSSSSNSINKPTGNNFSGSNVVISASSVTAGRPFVVPITNNSSNFEGRRMHKLVMPESH